MKFISIAAVAKNGAIGKNGNLPWSIPEDLRFFRDSTRGQVVLMGRKTFESLGKALPGRVNLVVSRSGCPRPDTGAQWFRSIEEARSWCVANVTDRDCFVIGGGEIYRLAQDWVDEIWLTEIQAEFEGDVFYPDFDELSKYWDRKLTRSSAMDGPNGPLKFDFVTYLKRP